MQCQEIGVYIHIPFCKQKCYYCDFISYCNKEHKIPQYIEEVKKEIKEKLSSNNYKISTIYIGGGTPSSIDSKYIRDILQMEEITKNLKEKAEITIEVNPGTVTKEKLQDYKKAGINRLSIGLQETDNKLLKSIGRIHTFEEFMQTYIYARKVGFLNINVDLIIGLPNQTIDNVESSLEKICTINPEHISVYSLIVQEGTVLSKLIESGKLQLPSEELERKMYWFVKQILEEHGYIHYEISNFAKENFYSRHNTDCWEQKVYLGFGVAAHSYIDKKRFSNTESLEKYLKDRNSNIELHELQEPEDEQNEFMLLNLRKIEGVSIQKFKEKFNLNPVNLYKEELLSLTKNNLITVDRNYIKLTNKGIDLANIVWEEFV